MIVANYICLFIRLFNCSQRVMFNLASEPKSVHQTGNALTGYDDCADTKVLMYLQQQVNIARLEGVVRLGMRSLGSILNQIAPSLHLFS